MAAAARVQRAVRADSEAKSQLADIGQNRLGKEAKQRQVMALAEKHMPHAEASLRMDDTINGALFF